MQRPAWQRHALCRGTGPAAFFPAGGSTAAVQALCAVCPVRVECASYAAETGSSGIWAGKSQTPHAGLINLERSRLTMTNDTERSGVP